MADDLDVARYQRHAAERIVDDEAWRDGLEDPVATPLLDAFLGLVDSAVASAATSSKEQALDDLAYEAADQARTLLTIMAGYWRGQSADEVLLAAEPALGPPLFASPDKGRQHLTAVMAAVALPSDPQPGDAPGGPAEPAASPAAAAEDGHEGTETESPSGSDPENGSA